MSHFFKPLVRPLIKPFIKSMLVASALALLQPAVAADVSVRDVYQAAESGHVQQAETMMQQVLRDHPESAKAHYVDAELYARSGQIDFARRELKTAQRLDPTLAFARPDAMEALQARLNTPSGLYGARTAFPWSYLLLGLALIAAVAFFLRALMQRNSVQGVAMPYGPGASYAPASYGPGYGPTGGGMGSGIMGGLATGAAVGAGIVAGEALANRFMDGSHGEHVQPASSDSNANTLNDDNLSNDNMGGNDFGLNDSSSWDSSSNDLGSNDMGSSDVGGDWS